MNSVDAWKRFDAIVAAATPGQSANDPHALIEALGTDDRRGVLANAYTSRTNANRDHAIRDALRVAIESKIAARLERSSCRLAAVGIGLGIVQIPPLIAQTRLALH